MGETGAVLCKINRRLEQFNMPLTKCFLTKVPDQLFAMPVEGRNFCLLVIHRLIFGQAKDPCEKIMHISGRDNPDLLSMSLSDCSFPKPLWILTTKWII